jgi:hypothetical protein
MQMMMRRRRRKKRMTSSSYAMNKTAVGIDIPYNRRGRG